MSLRELRQKRGLTQRQLADKSGVPHTRIAATETGSRPIENMSLGMAIKLCDALKVSNPRKLLEAEKQKKTLAQASCEPYSIFERRPVSGLIRCSP